MLVSHVSDWFYSNDGLLETIERFLDDNKPLFSTEGGNPDSPDEYSLPQYDAYSEYCKLWEAEIEGFVTQELNSTVKGEQEGEKRRQQSYHPSTVANNISPVVSLPLKISQ